MVLKALEILRAKRDRLEQEWFDDYQAIPNWAIAGAVIMTSFDVYVRFLRTYFLKHDNWDLSVSIDTGMRSPELWHTYRMIRSLEDGTMTEDEALMERLSSD